MGDRQLNQKLQEGVQFGGVVKRMRQFSVGFGRYQRVAGMEGNIRGQNRGRRTGAKPQGFRRIHIEQKIARRQMTPICQTKQ